MDKETVIFSIILSLLVVFGFVLNKVLTNFTHMAMEYAYSEGQIDALRGEVKVDTLNMVWIPNESPWDEGTEPMYNSLKDYRK